MDPYGTAPSTNLLEKDLPKNVYSFSKEILEEFLSRLEASGRSEMRVNGLRQRLTQFGKAVNWGCSLSDVTNYLNERKKDVSKRTLKDDIQMIKQFLKDQNISWIDKIKPPKVNKKRPRRIARKDILNLMDEMAQVDTEHKYFFRAKTAVILSSVSGMRPWEVYRLDWKDINIEDRIINLPPEKTKTRDERFVIFNEEAQELLQKLSDIFGNQPFSTKTIYCVTNKLNPKPKTKLKHCRKYFSQQWDRQGLPTSIKEMLMGHFGSIDLSNYNSQTPEDLREIYDKGDFEIIR